MSGGALGTWNLCQGQRGHCKRTMCRVQRCLDPSLITSRRSSTLQLSSLRFQVPLNQDQKILIKGSWRVEILTITDIIYYVSILWQIGSFRIFRTSRPGHCCQQRPSKHSGKDEASAGWEPARATGRIQKVDPPEVSITYTVGIVHIMEADVDIDIYTQIQRKSTLGFYNLHHRYCL